MATPHRVCPRGGGDTAGWPKPQGKEEMGERFVFVVAIVVVFVVVDVVPFIVFSSMRKNS